MSRGGGGGEKREGEGKWRREGRGRRGGGGGRGVTHQLLAGNKFKSKEFFCAVIRDKDSSHMTYPGLDKKALDLLYFISYSFPPFFCLPPFFWYSPIPGNSNWKTTRALYHSTRLHTNLWVPLNVLFCLNALDPCLPFSPPTPFF